MYDPETASLIRSSPPLAGLDRENLPDLLTEADANIVAARLKLRGIRPDDSHEIADLVGMVDRLAFTNEALVSVSPTRPDRQSAAFVSATAHTLRFNAAALLQEPLSTDLSYGSISSNIAAMLLYLVAEAPADAGEVSKSVATISSSSIEGSLIDSLKDLARGRLGELIDRDLPSAIETTSHALAQQAASALYLEILRGVRALAKRILLGPSVNEQVDPVESFHKVCQLSLGVQQDLGESWIPTLSSSIAGPRHLASLLRALSQDLPNCAVTNIPPPTGIDSDTWTKSLQRIAKSRPFLWRNHRDAVSQGYLDLGTSAAVSFPTGAGKTTLAELKINVALQAMRKVICLAPTHALVDQTARSLAKSFPKVSVQRNRDDDQTLFVGEELPEVLVMTPEACLAQLGIDPSVLSDVGLVVFDECHLLHPDEGATDRRAVDSMLCLLSLSQVASTADFLLLSAMMKNTEEIAGWLEELTSRPCLSLSLSWKPTRQLRGSVVYQQDTVTELQERLGKMRRKKQTSNPSAALKRSLTARPMALFSMKQTWATADREDYALVALQNSDVTLSASKYWKLTPNAVSVTSSLSAGAAESGLKSLAFFQGIKNAYSAAKQVSKHLGKTSIDLTEDESRWLTIATTELGGHSHLYLDVEDGRVTQMAAVHHGLLLEEERLLVESLFKRSDGLSALTATSTLAQGMNLPSDVVIIGEDHRFDQAQDRREILQAQELLNAAGRAGRAGQAASGIVLVVPGKVVGIDFEEATIGAHWTSLREIFGQSDQCLSIDDPLTAVLDRVHGNLEDVGHLERYAVLRLASVGADSAASSALSKTISYSFASYLKRKANEQEWIEERITSATGFFDQQSPESDHERTISHVAASLGLSFELVSRLSAAIELGGPNSDAKIPDWRRWFFRWLADNPDLLEETCRRQSLLQLFGKKEYGALTTDSDKADYALPRLGKLIWLWMRGEPLSELEKSLGTSVDKLGNCVKARQFSLRVVPDLSYLFGIPAILHERSQVATEEPIPVPSALSQLRRCVRLGCNFHEKIALNQLVRDAHFSRRQVHQHFALMKPYLNPATKGESWEQTVSRVESIMEAELSARDLNGF